MERVFLQELSTIFQHHAPAARAAGTVNSAADRDQLASGDESNEDSLVIVEVGTPGGTPDDYTLTVTLQESDDDSTYTAVTGKQLVITQTSAGYTVTYGEIAFSPKALKRYIRLAAVLAFTAGTSPTLPYSAIEIRTGFAKDPQA